MTSIYMSVIFSTHNGEHGVDHTNAIDLNTLINIDALNKAWENDTPIKATYHTDCREGILYEVGNTLIENGFIQRKYPYSYVKLDIDILPYGFSQPYLNDLFIKLQTAFPFAFDFNDETKLTTFNCASMYFNIPLYSCLLYLLKYGGNIFYDLEQKNTLDHGDLFTIVNCIVNTTSLPDDILTAYSIWYYLKTNKITLFKKYDSMFGNSVSGIAHNTEERLNAGFDLHLFTKFIKEYNISKKSLGSWLSYIIEMQETNPYNNLKHARYEEI